MAQLVEESEVRLQRDPLPLDVVEIAFQFPEAFHLQHPTEYTRQLSSQEDVLPVLRIINVHRTVLATAV